MSDLSENNEPLTLNIPSINQSYDLSSLILSNQILDISLPKITYFTISKSEQTIAIAPFTLIKGVQWIQFNYETKKKSTLPSSFALSLIECIKVKIKCTIQQKKPHHNTTSNNKKSTIRNKMLSTFGDKSPLLKGSIIYNGMNNSTNSKHHKANKDMHNRSYECSINFDAYFDEVKDEEPTTTSTTTKNKNNITSFSNYCNYNTNRQNSNQYITNDTQLNKTINTSINKTRNVNAGSKHLQVQKIQRVLKKEKLSELTLNNNIGNNNGSNSNINVNLHNNSYKPLSSLVPKERSSFNKNQSNINNTGIKISRHKKTNSNFSGNKNNDLHNYHNKNISINNYPEKNVINQQNHNIENENILHSSLSEELFKLINGNNNTPQLNIQNVEQEPLENFNQVKNDFILQYSNEYLQNIPNDLLKLELELLVEKMFELVTCYHSQLDNAKYFYEKINYLSKEYYSKFMKLNHNYLELQYQKERLHSLTQNPKNLYGQLSNIFNTSKDEIYLFNELIQDKNKTKQNKNGLLKSIINKVLYENGNYSAITNENEKTFIDKYFSYRKTVTFSLNKSSDVNKNKGVINKSNLNKISMPSYGGNFTTSLVSNKEKNKKVMGVKKNIKRK